MHIIPDTQIVKPTEQWSPYPTGRDVTQATAWENLLSGIPRDEDFFRSVAPGDMPPRLPDPVSKLDAAEQARVRRELEEHPPVLLSWAQLKGRVERGVDPRVRFGETIPVQKIEPMEFHTLEPVTDEVIGFVGPCAEGNRALVRLSVSREQAAKIEEGTKPISMGFTPAICEDSAIMRARDWLESDGIPEAIGTDDEDTKPSAPRASEPIYPGQSLAW